MRLSISEKVVHPMSMIFTLVLAGRLLFSEYFCLNFHLFHSTLCAFLKHRNLWIVYAPHAFI